MSRANLAFVVSLHCLQITMVEIYSLTIIVFQWYSLLIVPTSTHNFQKSDSCFTHSGSKREVLLRHPLTCIATIVSTFKM
jgi:hypothetical protein